MQTIPLSFFRRLTLHLWKDVARDPTIFGTVDLDVTNVQALIADIARERGVKVSVFHAAALAIAKSFRRFPDLNRKVIGKRIVELDTVDVSFPVTLAPEKPGDPEIMFGKVVDLDQRTLADAGDGFRAATTRARELAAAPMTRWSDQLGRYLPDWMLGIGMNQGWALFKRINFARFGIRHHPFGSTTISNIGALGPIDGLTNMSTMALLIPMGYASSFLLGPTLEKPVVVDGKVEVRPMASLTYGIDHRVVDGFGFMRYVDYWVACFRDPAHYLMQVFPDHTPGVR